MQRATVLAALLAAWLAPCPCFSQTPPARRPNVLFIAFDDLKPLLGCYGVTSVKSPNIDRLGASGAVFLNNYCQQAVCGPTRASLLTGLRPDTTKIWDLETRMRDILPDVLTLPQYFKQNGYHTVAMGKVFDGRCCDGPGKQDARSWSQPHIGTGSGLYAEPGKANARLKPGDKSGRTRPSTENADVADEAYQDGRMSQRAIEELKKLSAQEQPFDAVAMNTQSAAEAYEVVLAEAGVTLPSRDPVDLRIVNDVRNGTGHVIEKETDLPLDQCWPQYVALPAPTDSDADGIPDYWEEQFGLDKNNPADSMAISAGGYANIEHYFNNTDPKGGSTPIVFVAASVSRARPENAQAGVLRVMRTGSTAAPLVVHYTIGGTTEAGADFEKLSSSVTIPAGNSAVAIPIVPCRDARGGKEKTVVVHLTTGQKGYHVGCPSAALVVIED